MESLNRFRGVLDLVQIPATTAGWLSGIGMGQRRPPGQESLDHAITIAITTVMCASVLGKVVGIRT